MVTSRRTSKLERTSAPSQTTQARAVRQERESIIDEHRVLPDRYASRQTASLVQFSTTTWPWSASRH